MRGLSLGLILFAAGCQKSDTETLSRIGRKVADRGQTALSDLRARIDLNWKPPAFEPDLAERVRLRLRFDSDLEECTIEVKGEGKHIELRGKVLNPEQKRRAAELAQTTRGIEVVEDRLEVQAPLPPPIEKAPEEKEAPEEAKENGE